MAVTPWGSGMLMLTDPAPPLGGDFAVDEPLEELLLLLLLLLEERLEREEDRLELRVGSLGGGASPVSSGSYGDGPLLVAWAFVVLATSSTSVSEPF